MEARTRTMVTFVVLVVLLFGLYFFSDWFSRTVGYATGEEQRIRLMQCLDEKQAILYIDNDCYHCDEQASLIGKTALSYFNSVLNCGDGESVACSDLESFPAWKIDGEVYYGIKEIDELSELSGCESVIE